MSDGRPLRMGTRASLLARTQSGHVADALTKVAERHGPDGRQVHDQSRRARPVRCRNTDSRSGRATSTSLTDIWASAAAATMAARLAGASATVRSRPERRFESKRLGLVARLDRAYRQGGELHLVARLRLAGEMLEALKVERRNRSGLQPDRGVRARVEPRDESPGRRAVVAEWTYGAPQGTGWNLDRRGRVRWGVPLAGPAERVLTKPERVRYDSLTKRTRLGLGSQHFAQQHA